MFGALTRRAEYLRVYERHVRVSGAHFVLLAHVQQTETPKAGPVVSKKVGKAVRRNLVKRRIRAYLREHKELSRLARDIILIARPGSAELDWRAFREELDGLFSTAMRKFCPVDAHASVQ